jgi:hypothetical protein
VALAQSSLMRSIARGPLWIEFESAHRTSLLLDVALCPLGPAFIAKGKVGRHHKSISRNGLIILMSAAPLQELLDATLLRLRLAIWHRSHLPNDPATPYGLLLNVRLPRITQKQVGESGYRTLIAAAHARDAALSLELGGGRFLNFYEMLA